MTEGQASGDRVIVTVADGVADVRLNRPDKLNALDPAMLDALAGAGDRLRNLEGLRAVVLSGEGRAFCAGLDMASFAAIASAGPAGLASDIVTRTHGAANLFQHAAMVWRAVPAPVIAALDGAVFGGGFQIALGADLRYVAPTAQLSVMEVRWGLVPDMGGTVLLRGLVRGDVARELTYTGRTVPGEEAAALGLATRLCADPRAEAFATARSVAARSPDAVGAAKRLFNRWDAEVAAALAAESAEQAGLLGTPNQIEAVRAAMAKRPPVFRDRTASGNPRAPQETSS